MKVKTPNVRALVDHIAWLEALLEMTLDTIEYVAAHAQFETAAQEIEMLAGLEEINRQLNCRGKQAASPAASDN